jgi:uncharacterized protein (DUF1015 family)
MAEIRPFRAFRYDTNRVPLDQVLTQPYDKITPAMQERYYAASPYNLIAIEKGKAAAGDTAADNVYTRATKTLEDWIREKILVPEAAPSIYVYSQEFFTPGTQTRHTRTGFIALGRVEDYEAQVVFRHERTLAAPKADRMELLRHTRAQTGQLFMLYNDPARNIESAFEEIRHKSTPLELRDEFGVAHRLWPVADARLIGRVQKEMTEKKLVIADGHHRYETALNYRNECRAREATAGRMAAHEFAMMTFVNTHSKGLVILPTHRVVRNLAGFEFERFRKQIAASFDWYAYPFAGAEERPAAFTEFRKDLEKTNHGRRAIGAYAGGAAFYLFLLRRGLDLELAMPDLSAAQRDLDVVLLHRLILEKELGITAEAVAGEQHIRYEREADVAMAAVDKGEAQLAFLLNPVRVQQVMDIALGGHVLPQKSTDFYPKLLSGVAIFRIEGEIGE